jgi:hypothetical protein
MRIALALLVSALACSAGAQEITPAGRYDLVPVPAGALRLDTETGAVSLCAEANGALACRPVRDEGMAENPPQTADRIAALEARIAALESKTEASGPALSDDEAVDRVADLADKVMRRFFGMVRQFQREMDGEQL